MGRGFLLALRSKSRPDFGGFPGVAGMLHAPAWWQPAWLHTGRLMKNVVGMCVTLDAGHYASYPTRETFLCGRGCARPSDCPWRTKWSSGLIPAALTSGLFCK